MNEYKTDVMKRYKSLTKKEQVAFYNKMKEGSESARQKLIDSCLPLVIDMAKKFSITNKHVELEDLVQEGNVALVRAVDSWDANKGSITTIATYYIKSSLVNMIQDCNYHIQYSLGSEGRVGLQPSHIWEPAPQFNHGFWGILDDVFFKETSFHDISKYLIS